MVPKESNHIWTTSWRVKPCVIHWPNQRLAKNWVINMLSPFLWTKKHFFQGTPRPWFAADHPLRCPILRTRSVLDMVVSCKGVPPNHPFLDGIFPYKPSIWGYPHDELGNPHMFWWLELLMIRWELDQSSYWSCFGKSQWIWRVHLDPHSHRFCLTI